MKKQKVTKTNLKIPVKPVSDQGLTDEEFRQRIGELQKQREAMKVLDKIADKEFAKRKLRGPVKKTTRKTTVKPHPQYGYVPNEGLLAPESEHRSSPFMGLLSVPKTGSEG